MKTQAHKPTLLGPNDGSSEVFFSMKWDGKGDPEFLITNAHFDLAGEESYFYVLDAMADFITKYAGDQRAKHETAPIVTKQTEDQS